MNGTPGPHRAAPRLSGIPTPGRGSGIPTPGRPRHSIPPTPTALDEPPLPEENELLQRALSDAIKANDPARFRPGLAPAGGVPGSPDRAEVGRRQSHSARTPYAPRASLRPPSVASAASSSSSARLQIPHGDSPSSYTTAPTTPINRSGPVSRARTPLTATPRATSTFTPSRRPDSRQSVGRAQTGRSVSRMGQAAERSASRLDRPFEVGDRVRIESLGVEGTLRYLGDVHFKPGVWAGVELSGGFAERGKNDGAVDGTRYFECPPKCGVFVASSKLSSPAPTYTRPQSSASVQSSFSRSGRATPGMFASRSNDFETPVAARARQSEDTAAVAAGRITAGSRASRYVGMTAQQLSSRPAEPKPASPTRSPTRAPTVTPRAAGRQSIGVPTPAAYRGRMSVGGVTPKPIKSLKNDSAPLSPSLSMPALSVTTTGGDATIYEEDSRMLESTTRAFQDRVQKLMSDDLTVSARSSPLTSPSALSENVFPHSPITSRNETKLLERIEALETENERLVEELNSKPDTTDSGAFIGELQNKIRDTERLLRTEREQTEALQNEVKEQASLRESEKEHAAEILQAAEERVEEAEKRVQSFMGEMEERKAKSNEVEQLLDVKATELDELEKRLQLVMQQANEERDDLLGQVEDLRKAGQETIALYEERLASVEAARYDLEDQIQALEDQLKLAATKPALSIASDTTPADSVAMIDNETLREQVAHYQSRITKLEDQLEDMQAERLKQEESDKARVVKAREQEAAARKETDVVRKEVDRVAKAELLARAKIDELEVALKDNEEALENARAEVEGLRAELSNRAALPESSSDRKLDKVVSEHTEEVTRLTELLEATRLGREAAISESEALKGEIDASNQVITDLRTKLESLDRDKMEADRMSLELPSSDRRRESYSSNSSKLSRVSSTDKADKEARDQIKGLKHMVQELQKENSALVSQMKMLEADNKALRAESDDLKEALNSLEETVEARIAEEEQALERDTQGVVASDTSGASQQNNAELRARHESEVQQLKQLAKKHERTIHDLNKEVAELESLVESKIYREDDLERELERCKEKLARAQRSSKASTEKSSSGRTSNHSVMTAATQSTAPTEEDVCEICGGKGHDIASCPVFTASPSSFKRANGEIPPSPSDTKSSPQPWCDDCESFGHSTTECPHSQDVF